MEGGNEFSLRSHCNHMAFILYSDWGGVERKGEGMLIVAGLKSDCDVSLHSCSREKTGGGTNSRCVMIVCKLYSYCIPIGGGGGGREGKRNYYCMLIVYIGR